jgi:hypothetical protein
MSRRKEIVLTRQLDQLLAGALALDDATPEALALLPVAAGIELDRSVHMAASSLEAGRAQLLAAIASVPREQPRRLSLPGWLQTPALAGGLAAALSGGAIAYAAQGAAPDSPLYPVHEAVQAVAHVVPALQQPTPTPVPTPTATTGPGATRPPDDVSPARVRGQNGNAPGTPNAITSSSAVAQDRKPDEGEQKRRVDGSAQHLPTASTTPANRTGRQGDSRPFSGPGNGRAVRDDLRSGTGGDNDGNGNGRGNGAANGGGNANGDGDNGAENQNGRAGDRSARFNRGS